MTDWWTLFEKVMEKKDTQKNAEDFEIVMLSCMSTCWYSHSKSSCDTHKRKNIAL